MSRIRDSETEWHWKRDEEPAAPGTEPAPDDRTYTIDDYPDEIAAEETENADQMIRLTRQQQRVLRYTEAHDGVNALDVANALGIRPYWAMIQLDTLVRLRWLRAEEEHTTYSTHFHKLTGYPTPSTPGTLIQYARACRDAYLAESPGLSAREYEDAYPPESRLDDWITALSDAARRGAVLRAMVLDDLFRRAPMAARAISRDSPGALPANYLFPDVRKATQVHEAEMRAARRRERHSRPGAGPASTTADPTQGRRQKEEKTP